MPGALSPGVSSAAGSPVFGGSLAAGAGGEGSEARPSPAGASCVLGTGDGGAGAGEGAGGVSGERVIDGSGVGKGAEGTGVVGLSVGDSTIVSDVGFCGAGATPAGAVSGPP